MTLFARRTIATGFAAAACLLGCATEPNRFATQGPAPTAADATRSLVYDLDASATTPLFAESSDPSDQSPVLAAVFVADRGESSVGTTAAETTGPLCSRLNVVDAGHGTARATLVLFSVRSSRPTAIYELEIPAPELSLILSDLRTAGVFDGQERPGGGARFEIRSPDGTSSKEWTPEPRLDELVERVYRSGRPTTRGHHEPTGRVRLTPVPPAPAP